ncbi:sensor histidine kinase [Paracoccus fontiphilus]|uniref:histidine kinase n=1 Tax=Paracoccus fontiphilus TaxID=1815556 RepID=A0ABV7IIC3_9RHOB|nr:HWE histidine kinase domain-containing protein [Paracoccus fontiphilus]
MNISPEALAELRRRLLEAEETLRAIREGEVDALVIGMADRPQVFSIGGDTEAFRAFIEVMDSGAAAVDQAGRILYANGHFKQMLKAGTNDLQGVLLDDLLPGDKARDLLVAGRPARTALEIALPSGARHLIMASSPLQLGTVAGYAITLTDVTERIRAERAEQSELIAQSIIASVNEAVLVCDGAGRVTHSNGSARAILGVDPAGARLADLLPLRPDAASGFKDTAGIVEAALGGKSLRGIEVLASQAPGPQEFLISAAPLDVPGAPGSGCVISIFDIANRKALERQQHLLMGELDHRVKNTLALVLSISRQTFRHSESYRDFEAAFTSRIHALSATHNLLSKNAWTGLSVHDVIEAETAPFAGSNRARIEMAGLDRHISSEAAIALGLISHELVTNAVKYGALSMDAGRVIVTARRDSLSHPLVIEWRERGGPAVVPPTKKGYGQTVITQSMQFAPGGDTSLDYDPAGLVCTINIPSALVLS